MRLIILIAFIPVFAMSQVEKLENGKYIIEGGTLSNLDYAAKKYIQCSTASDSIQEQLSILDSVRIIKDTFMIKQQREIFSLRNSRILLEGENMALKKTNSDLKLNLKDEKRKTFWWKIFAFSAISLGTFIATR